MVLQQIPLVTINPANNLHKPLIYAPDATSFSVVHHAHVRGLVWPHPSLKMMHLRHGRYNIPGRQNWGAIPPEIVQQVEPANMQYLVCNCVRLNQHIRGVFWLMSCLLVGKERATVLHRRQFLKDLHKEMMTSCVH